MMFVLTSGHLNWGTRPKADEMETTVRVYPSQMYPVGLGVAVVVIVQNRSRQQAIQCGEQRVPVQQMASSQPPESQPGGEKGSRPWLLPARERNSKFSRDGCLWEVRLEYGREMAWIRGEPALSHGARTEGPELYSGCICSLYERLKGALEPGH